MDKILHLLAGMGFALIAPLPEDGLRAAVIAGVAKEAFDSRTHKPDARDLLATVAGGLLVYQYRRAF